MIRAGAVVVLGASTLTACASPAPAAEGGASVVGGIEYWSDANETLLLDACLPPERETPSPAIVLLHGGGFVDGDRVGGGMRALCRQMSDRGVATFSIDYRLAPDHRYPSQVEDASHAIEWLRAPEQVERFGIDPARIGVFGSSAGAIIAQSIGMAGSGPTDVGARVSAVVSLSGVSLMTEEALGLGEPSPEAINLILNYLGCTTASAVNCAQAEAASPLGQVDSSDPPTMLVTGAQEFVPVEQAQRMQEALLAAGVPAELVVVDGSRHGVQLLRNDVRAAVVEFFATHL
ncbi:alpha/beta hydrolase [Agromyces binzhouensis]|uniref:alpha/beta hydrolase n=1 Tax=Agromyces binzhouensis TaxID=1817495 RepID=UPI00363E0A56